MRHHAPPGIKGVARGVFQEIRDRVHVDVGESEQSPGEIRRVVICSEHRAELLIEDRLDLVSQLVPLLHPFVQHILHFRPFVILMLLDQTG